MSATISGIEASDTVLVRELRRVIADQQRTIRRQEREISELRSVVKAFTEPQPAVSENLPRYAPSHGTLYRRNPK